VTRAREAMVRPVTSTDPVLRSSGSLESAGPARKGNPEQGPVNSGGVNTTPEKFENAALFLRLGLPSTLIRHERSFFSNTLFKPKGFENAGFSF